MLQVAGKSRKKMADVEKSIDTSESPGVFPAPLNKRKILVACEIFRQEVLAVLPLDEAVEIVWIEAALHTCQAKLESALETALSQSNAQEASIHILFGNGCHPDICNQAKKYGVALPCAKNCIEIFCKNSEELQADNTLIMTPGWIRNWLGMMKNMGWDRVDMRINLGRYEKILVLDPGIDPLTEEEIFSFFDLAEIPLDIQPLDLSYFKSVLDEVLH
jgi:hypothetical protein